MRVELKKATKVLGRRKVLDGVSASLENGRIYGLYGRNGSGKTMLLRAMCGLVTLTSGAVEIDGEPLRPGKSFPQSVGVLIENPGFVESYSGMRNLHMIASIRSSATDEDIEFLMRLFDLDPGDRRKVRAYSLGMKQKLGIVCALMERPSLVLLDEPFNALDDAACATLSKLLTAMRNEGALVVVASHDRVGLEAISDSLLFVERGRVSIAEIQEDK